MSSYGLRGARVSLRALMAAIALVALVITPIAWHARWQQLLRVFHLQAMAEEERARAAALRVYREQQARAKNAATGRREAVDGPKGAAAEPLMLEVERLRRENRTLRQEIRRLEQRSRSR